MVISVILQAHISQLFLLIAAIYNQWRLLNARNLHKISSTYPFPAYKLYKLKRY